MSKENDDRGLLIRIFSDKDIQIAVALFAIALILAFAAVTTTTETERLRDILETEDDEPEFTREEIYYPGLLDVSNATLEFIAEGGDTNFTVELLNSDFDPLWSNTYELEEGEGVNESVPDLHGIDSEDPPEHLEISNVTGGNLIYTYTVSYSRSPYGLLSIPAMIITLIGMVFGFRGHTVILGEIKRKKMLEKEKEKKEERAEREEGESEEADEKLGEVIYEDEDGERSQEKGDGSHVDFMGIPSDDEDK